MPRSRYYKILGLQPNASEKEVRKRYRQLVMQYHPDRNSSPDAEEMFIRITEAYEVILNKKNVAVKSKRGKTEEEKKQEREERVKAARERYAEQLLKERIENEIYFKSLTSGAKWKTLRVMAIVGVCFSLFLVADFFLPHHYEKDQITHFRRNVGSGPTGQHISLLKTKKNNYYWISNLRYSLYKDAPHIYVESSWIFHNPIQLISIEKLRYRYFETHFTFYHGAGFLMTIFLLPFATMLYKRRKISFTFLFFTCYYGVSTVMLIFLFTGNRWAHVITFGFF